MSGLTKKAQESGAKILRTGIPLWGAIAVAATLTTIAGFAFHGFDENGLRLGSLLAWRFAFLVYVAAIASGSLARLLPWEWLRPLERARRQLRLGFCASFAVFLASLLVPNTLMLATVEHQGLTMGMGLFVLFGAGLTLVIAYTVEPRPNLGEQTRRAILGVGLTYFWLAYALTSLSRLHDPDAFYELSLLLLAAALLLRLADQLVVRIKRRKGALS